MSEAPPNSSAAVPQDQSPCAEGCCEDNRARNSVWLGHARTARLLSWFSLGWMTIEGLVGVVAGTAAGSIALVGWALGSAIEGLASIIVIWRLTGGRMLSQTAEARANRAVAVSFFLLAPYIAIESIRDLITGNEASSSIVGILLTASSVVVMPALGIAKRRLGGRLGSGATTGEGTQNLLCAAQAAAVLLSLGLTAALGWGWVDPLIGLGVAVVAIKEGRDAWRGEGCSC